MTERYREDLGEIDKLPAELRKEIKRGRANKQQQILDAIEDRGTNREISSEHSGWPRNCGKT